MFGAGALQFENAVLMAEGSAITLGNVQVFAGNATDPLGGIQIQNHERQHTLQGQLLGPFYLPVYFLGGVVAALNGRFPLGAGNFMETGPYRFPPTPWGN